VSAAADLVSLPSRPGAFPVAPLASLDTLWFQVAGTLCNLACTHCFISCSPRNRAHRMLSLDEVLRHLEEARRLGVREYYFTGGEPFMNRDLLAMLGATLAQGPATVLTNGLLVGARHAARLADLASASEYTLDVRVSLDGLDAATNDAVRGEGAFERALEGVRRLARAGLSPMVTVSEVAEGAGSRAGRTRLHGLLREAGIPRPRLKILPVLRIGAEERRARGYAAHESLAHHHLTDEDLARLQCTTARMVTSEGVFVCPILIASPSARLGATLEEARRPFPLAAPACWTCHAEGLTCAT
jgi:molybdenum cofactor biosynthesis enzyme MoaA